MLHCLTPSFPTLLFSDLRLVVIGGLDRSVEQAPAPAVDEQAKGQEGDLVHRLPQQQADILVGAGHLCLVEQADIDQILRRDRQRDEIADRLVETVIGAVRSEEHTSELQSLMRISYAVFCLKKKTNSNNTCFIKFISRININI